MSVENPIYFDIPKDGFDSLSGEDVTIITDENAVEESVKNIIDFSRGSLIYKKKTFGSSIRKYLFEPIDASTAHSILKELEKSILEGDDRVKNLDIEITPYPDENAYDVVVRFTVDESERPIEFTTTLEKKR